MNSQVVDGTKTLTWTEAAFMLYGDIFLNVYIGCRFVLYDMKAPIVCLKHVCFCFILYVC